MPLRSWLFWRIERKRSSPGSGPAYWVLEEVWVRSSRSRLCGADARSDLLPPPGLRRPQSQGGRVDSGPAQGGRAFRAREYDRLLSRYLRGQITVALMMGVITTLGLLIFRFPNALLLGVLVAVFSVVPYLGLILSLIPALFIALVSGNVGFSLLTIAIVYGGSQVLEGAVISPRIVGESVGLHPVWVVLALAVSGFFLGFVGLLIAVPLAVGVKLVAVRGAERYRESDLFRGETLLEE